MIRRWFGLVMVGFAALLSGCISVPEGFHVHISETGCTSDGTCPFGGEGPANFYWAPLREIVLIPNQGHRTIAHEVCHAHQHQTILNETGQEPGIGLRAWHTTSEGISFHELAAQYPHPWPWISQEDIVLEDFANTCSLWLTAPRELKQRSAERYAWAERNL